ncbi:MAG TPA: PAS domain S-box protein [Acidobacteriota bacterium]|nr:PAS domain S-box protein [Acidobacteriota bacterium]
MTEPPRRKRTKPQGAAASPAADHSEPDYRAVLEQAADGIILTDAELQIRLVNDRACVLLGYTREELLRRNAADVPTAEELRIHPIEVERLRAGGPVVTQRRLQRRDGSTFIAETNAIRLADGWVVAVLRDVTERVRTEQRLAESEARYGAVVERATVGITVTDADWRFVEVNPRACEIFGYPRERLLGMTVRDIAAPGELAGVPLHEPELRAGLDSFTRRRIRRPDGTERIVEISARDLGDRQVVSIVNDVTDRREAEQRLATSERNLARAQELAQFGTWEVDLVKYTGRWSPEMYRIFGLSPERAPITYDAFISCLHPEDRADMERWVREAIAGQPVLRKHEHRVLHADGSVRVVAGTLEAQRDEAGRVVRLMGSSQDITEQRLLELQLREAQKLEAIGRLAGGVAHDFNNLLTVILGFVETMLDGMSAADANRGPAEQIRLAARRAAALTQQLLAFGRRQMFRLEVFDLNAVLGEMREILRRLIGEQIEILITPGARWARVEADRGQIEQVILNLALNARDAMPSGGRLEIATANVDRPSGGPGSAPGLLLTVSDTGMGMSAEVQAHIFEPFYTTKDVGQGTGLGLATVHGIVSQSGGRIEVRSSPGAGTCFRIQLPCAADADEVTRAVGTPLAALDDGDETVLLAEDDPAVRSLVADVLRTRGYRVLEAADGDEAAQIGARLDGAVDLLIADIVMPGMSGRELVRTLLEQWPGLRALLISGYSGERTEPDEPAPGAVAFLQKPFSPGALARRVREVLDGPGGKPARG